MSTIGSSEAAVCLGVQRRAADGTPYTSELELWARLTGLVPRYDPPEAAGPVAQLGNWLEPSCLMLYSTTRSRVVEPGPRFGTPGWTHPTLPFLHARPDAVDTVDQRVVEAKCPRCLDPERWGPFGSDEVPVEHWVQVCVQVAIGHRLHRVSRDAHVVAMARDPGGWNDPRPFAIYDLHIDEAREAAVLARIHAWHQKHVIEGLPPGPDGSPSAGRTLDRMFRPTDIERQATVAEVELHHRLLQVREAATEREKTATELRQQLQMFMGDATALKDGRRTLATWRPDKNGRRRWVVKQRRAG